MNLRKEIRKLIKEQWFGPVLSDVDVLDGAERIENIIKNIILDMKSNRDKSRVRRNTASLYEDLKTIIDESIKFMNENNWRGEKNES